MITIKKQQFNSLSKYMLGSFEKKAVMHLRNKFPVKTKSNTETELYELVKEGIDRASGYYIDDRKSVLLYLEYMICFGKDFDVTSEDVWVSRCLNLSNIHGSEKIKSLIENVPLNPEIQ